MPMPFPLPDSDAPMYICMPMNMPPIPGMPPVPPPVTEDPVEEPGMLSLLNVQAVT